MTEDRREDIRNLAIIAHVDHGKTTLADAMIWQCDLFRKFGVEGAESAARRAPDREKSVAVMPKIISVVYGDVRINILDTPGHPNFGSEVERTLRMVDGFILVVDACEGPLPQTRFVLRRALQEGLAPIVVINKIDVPGARPDEVLEEVRSLFLDLDASEQQQGFEVLYCNALAGTCSKDAGGSETMLLPLFEQILSGVPAPAHEGESGLRFLITDLDYDVFLGRLALGKLFHGSLSHGGEIAHCRLDGTVVRGKVAGIYGCDGMRRVERKEAGPGDVVFVSGVEAVDIGDTLAGTADPEPLPPVRVDEPTLSLVVSVNDSPTAGLDGKLVTGADLRERIWKEILTNVSIRVEETESPNAFRISGRGELQLVILLEMMRREGYELLVGRPEVITREIDGELHEPVEILVADCPEEFTAVVTQKVEDRKGKLVRMINHGLGRVRQEFRIPSRGLLGFRTEYINDTKGTGIMNHVFDGYLPWQGDIPVRSTGALVADRPGRATAHAIEHLQPRGTIFVAPGDQVYEGMVVGENTKENDVEVDITKERKSHAARPSPGADVMRIIPPRSMSLEHALEFIRDDEVVEVTPWGLRLRKKILQAARRLNP